MKDASAEPLLNMTGGLMLGLPSSTVVKGTLASIKTHNLSHQILSASDIEKRFPVFFAAHGLSSNEKSDVTSYLELNEEDVDTKSKAILEEAIRSDSVVGILEHEAGYLVPELCVDSHLSMAEEYGAELRFGESLISWTGGGKIDEDLKSSERHTTDTEEVITVITDRGIYTTNKIILSVGAWAPELYGNCLPANLKLHAERRVLYWLVLANSIHYCQ